jgi:hypothetical protein
MTDHDLAELLRHHVSHDEPPTPLALPAITTGRRRLRTSRLVTGGASLAVLALAAAVVVPRLGGSDGPDTAVDPASAAALAAYDAHAMPELMDDHVRAVLERSVADLGPSTFGAMDSQAQDLPEEYWDKASSLAVSYGGDTHGYDVSISHAKGEAEGNPERYCEDGLAEGYYLDCSVSRTSDGDVVISKLWALKPDSFMGDRTGDTKVVRRDRLDDVPLDQLSFERSIKVIKSQTLITYVSERVAATDRDPATAAFSTPPEDLVEIGTDPQLVMPVPPPGENGCPAWSMPMDDATVSCSG